MVDWRVDYYMGIKGIYFRRILKKIIVIGNLKDNKKKILDFGCGTGQLKKTIGNRVINYDSVKYLSEIDDWRDADFNTVVSNEVFHYMKRQDLVKFLDELHNKNKKVTLIVGLSKMGLLNKMAIFLSGKKDAHEGILLSNKEVMDILRKRFNILRKVSIFHMCDIYVMRFKQ